MSRALDDTTDNEVRAHLSWMRLYVHDMSESNWRDMQLRLERQIERLARALYPEDQP